MIIALIISFILAIIVLVKRSDKLIKERIILALILFIPSIDSVSGISISIIDKIKGDIVFQAIDKSFATTDALTIRQKDEELIGYLDISAAGIGSNTLVDIDLLNDSMLSYASLDKTYSDSLIFNKETSNMHSVKSNKRFRVLTNQLLK